MLDLEAAGDPYADHLRDLMDPLWYELSDEEHALLDARSPAPSSVVTPPVPATIGIESDITEILTDRPIARARFRIDNSGPGSAPFPDGDWLRVRITARLYDPRDAAGGSFDLPLAEGTEVVATARSISWTVVDLPLPQVIRSQYALAAKVFSADERYRQRFDPSNCRVSVATYGDLIRIDKTVLEDIYRRGGYGNPAAEEELKRNVREGVVVAVDGETLLRAAESGGVLRLDPIGRT